jgi:hypothetical protein
MFVAVRVADDGAASRVSRIARFLVVGFLSAACAVVRVEGYNNPTLPAPGWHLYGGLEVGYAVALPQAWAAFDLKDQADLAAGKCSSTQELRDLRKQLIDDLRARSVRLFMCDSTLDAQPDLPIGYAARTAVPSTTIDQYLERLPQAPGRRVVDRHHTQTNAGDMVVQRINETVTRSDGSVHGAVQLQFFLIRFDALHVCFLEFSSELGETYVQDAERIGTTFTPLR